MEHFTYKDGCGMMHIEEFRSYLGLHINSFKLLVI